MKKVFLITFLVGSAFFVYAQISLSSGSRIIVSNGTTLVVNDINNTSGTIDNDGTLYIIGDVTNNNGGMFDSGSSGTVTFIGSSAQEITGASTVHFYGTTNINNSSSVSISNTTTGASQQIHGNLSFTNGKLALTDFDLILDGTVDPSGVSSTSYIVTNGTGKLSRVVGSNDILFPVGNSSYNPITLNNIGTSDTYSVEVEDGKPSNFSGTTHIVNRNWVVSESVSGGSDIIVTTQWNAGEEESSFDRTKSCVGMTTDNGTNVSWGTGGTASGSNPYTRTHNSFSGTGTFMVGDYYYGGLVVDLKVLLAAAWNDANNNMDKTLNSAGLIPTTDPYGLGTTVASVPANAVDWIKVELRSSSNHATVANSYAKFVDVNGQIIEEDGSNLKITGAISGSYYIAVQHRNHFGIVSASTVEIGNSPTLNFSNQQTTAWQNSAITTNTAMKEVETGSFGLWEGDVSGDGYIKYNGSGADRIAILTSVGSGTPGNIISDTYSNNDANMDGSIKYNGSSSDRITILTVVGSSTPGVIYSEHIPE
jgi:hypothetical protein